MLVCTDVAAMGLDVSDLNLSVNIGNINTNPSKKLTKQILGVPKSAWKLKQQAGRVGRNGLPALDIVLVFPQRGKNICVTKNWLRESALKKIESLDFFLKSESMDKSKNVHKIHTIIFVQ